MSNYYETYRTNYFKVTDVDKLKEIVDNIDAELWENDEEENYYAFGRIGSWGYDTYYDEEDNEIDTCKELQNILDKDQVCIINSIGHEKLRYLTAYSTVITNDEIKYTDVFEKEKELVEPIIKFDPNKRNYY